MSSELHLSFTIPAEYVRGAEQDAVLDMPVSYAHKLSRVLSDGAIHALAEGITDICPEFRNVSPYVLLREVVESG